VLCKFDGTDWARLCTIEMKTEGNKLMLAIPRSEIGRDGDLFNLEFKWADNYTEKDIWSFYTEGDTAPYGRLNYVYSNAVEKNDNQ